MTQLLLGIIIVINIIIIVIVIIVIVIIIIIIIISKNAIDLENSFFCFLIEIRIV